MALAVSDTLAVRLGQLTLRVLVLQRPLRQFLSTSSLSQYTVFQGLVNLISLLNAPGPGFMALASFFSSSESLKDPSVLIRFETASTIAVSAALFALPLEEATGDMDGCP